MTEILHSPITPNNNNSSPSSCSSSPSTSSLSNAPPSSLTCAPPSSSTNNDLNDDFTLDKAERQQLSLLALLVTLLRKSCNRREEVFKAMEISWPTNVRHVAHVTFDRFNGFLGLPVEFEPEVPSRAPSASTSVFGVSTESMQLSFDSRGNSVPTILLLMQRRLYDLGGLQAEGIFRINAENSQEEFVREQLNRGLIPEGIDVHCLAGLIKAWLRELPTGVLDSLSPEQVMQSQTEEECIELVRCLPPTESALLDWAINLMADVVEHEHVNKMNARNVAMVFAPNMTQMADPLTALMYAVQVMNFLKTLILRTVREREDSIIEPNRVSRLEPFDDSGHQSPSRIDTEDADKGFESPVETCASNEPILESSGTSVQNNVIIADRKDLAEEKLISSEDQSCPAGLETPMDEIHTGAGKSKVGQSSTSAERKNRGKLNRQQSAEKTRGIRSLSSLDLRTERIEAWR